MTTETQKAKAVAMRLEVVVIPFPMSTAPSGFTAGWVGETARDPELSPEMTTGRAFTLVGRVCLRHLVANVPAVTERDGNALHQMGVALRRLRRPTSSSSKFARSRAQGVCAL